MRCCSPWLMFSRPTPTSRRFNRAFSCCRESKSFSPYRRKRSCRKECAVTGGCARTSTLAHMQQERNSHTKRHRWAATFQNMATMLQRQRSTVFVWTQEVASYQVKPLVCLGHCYWLGSTVMAFQGLMPSTFTSPSTQPPLTAYTTDWPRDFLHTKEGLWYEQQGRAITQ